ncbi:MAG: amidohydrolase [Clostridia bacterium]
MLLIRNAKLLTMGETDYLDGADLRVEEGRITQIGRELAQAGARVVDAHGLYALPGIIDAHCHIGMWEDGMGEEGADGNEATSPITPQLRAIDALNPEDRCFGEALHAGVTLVATGPGSANVIGGQFVAMKTQGHCIDEMIVRQPLALKIAFGENPKRVYGDKKQTPSTRMATAALLRQAFVDAQTYARKMMENDVEKRPERDLGKEILVQALEGKLRVKAHAHRADDIMTALRICREFGLNVSLEHCTEGWRIPDAIRAAGVPVILGPLLSDRSKIELRNLTFKAPALMHQAGIRFAMMTDHPVIPLEYLPVCAALAARNGLPEHEALRSITINAAWALGLDARVGSLEVGKDADFALYDAFPLDFRAHAKQVYVNGVLAAEN